MNISASTTYYKILIVSEIFSKTFGPFWTPNLKGQPVLLDIVRKALSFETFFAQQVFRNSLPFSSYLYKKYLGAKL